MDGKEQRERKDIRGIMLLAACIVVLALFVPVVQWFILFFLPAPVILLRLATQDIRFLAAMLVLILVPLGIFSGWSGWDMVFFTSMLLCGYVMGEGWRSGHSREFFVASGILCSMALWGAGLVFFSLAEGLNPLSFLEKQIGSALTPVFEMYEKMGVPKENLALWKDAVPMLQYRMARLFPAMMGAFLLIVGWLNLLLTRNFAKRMALDIPDPGLLRNWGVPGIFMWGIVACGAMYLLPIALLQILGLSGLLLLFTLYFLQGMAVMAFFFHTKRVPYMIRIVAYLLLAVQPVLFLPVLILGLCDTWFNFRKRIQAPPAT